MFLSIFLWNGLIDSLVVYNEGKNNLVAKIRVMIKLQACTKHAMVAFQSYMSQATLDWLSGTNCIAPNVNFCYYKATLGKTKCSLRDQVVTL